MLVTFLIAGTKYSIKATYRRKEGGLISGHGHSLKKVLMLTMTTLFSACSTYSRRTTSTRTPRD